MNSIISIIVTLAMLLSGGMYSETPDAASSRTLTISDAIVSINGEEYALTPTASVGIKTENGAVLLDASMNCAGETLFPAQAKLDENGATVLLGDSATAHTFSAELLNVEIPQEVLPLLDTVQRMIRDIPNLEKSEEAMANALTAAFEKASADAVSAETTLTISGAEVPATHTMFTIDHAEVLSLYDSMIEAYEGDFFDAYFEILNYAMTMAYVSEDGEAAPEIDSFSELFSIVPMTISIDVEQTLTADGAGEALLLMNITADDYGETVEMQMPMALTIYSPTACDVTMDLSDEEQGISMAATVSVDGEKYGMNMSMYVEEEYAPVYMNMNMTSEPGANGVNTASFVEMGDDEFLFAYEVISSMADDGTGVSDVFYGFEDASGQYGLSFAANISDADIADRTAQATATEVYTTEEDLENSSGLLMSLMGLAGDAEKLIAEPSVAALVEAVEALMPTVEDVEVEYVEESSEGNDDPSALSFAIPEFVLPENYELSEQYIYGEYDWANLVYSYVGEDDGEYHSDLYIDLSAVEDSSTFSYTLDEAGAMAQISGPVFTVQTEDEYFSAYTTWNGVSYSVSCFDNSFTVEDLAVLLSGI